MSNQTEINSEQKEDNIEKLPIVKLTRSYCVIPGETHEEYKKRSAKLNEEWDKYKNQAQSRQHLELGSPAHSLGGLMYENFLWLHSSAVLKDKK